MNFFLFYFIIYGVLLTKFNIIPQNDRHREKNVPGDNWPRAAEKNLS